MDTYYILQIRKISKDRVIKRTTTSRGGTVKKYSPACKNIEEFIEKILNANK